MLLLGEFSLEAAICSRDGIKYQKFCPTPIEAFSIGFSALLADPSGVAEVLRYYAADYFFSINKISPYSHNILDSYYSKRGIDGRQRSNIVPSLSLGFRSSCLGSRLSSSGASLTST